MTGNATNDTDTVPARRRDYRAPTIVRLGDLDDLTLQTGGKEVGNTDGTVFQGIDLGSV